MASKRDKKPDPPTLKILSVQSRPLREKENIKPGTLLTDHDADGREWFLIACSGFGMHYTAQLRKIIGPIGKGLKELKRNIELDRKERRKIDKLRKKAKGGPIRYTISTVDSPVGCFHRTGSVRVVTTKVKLDLTDII